MILDFARRSASAALLGVGLLLGGTAVAQMPSESGQTSQYPSQSAPSTDRSTNPSDIAQPNANTGSESAQPVVLVDPGKIYNAKDPTSWVGKTVSLQNVTVQDTNDSGNFWVGSDSGHRLLVVKADDPNLKAMRFHKGDVVTIQGVVHPASKYMAKETTASSGSMHDAESSSGVFLLANNVSITSSTQR